MLKAYFLQLALWPLPAHLRAKIGLLLLHRGSYTYRIKNCTVINRHAVIWLETSYEGKYEFSFSRCECDIFSDNGMFMSPYVHCPYSKTARMLRRLELRGEFGTRYICADSHADQLTKFDAILLTIIRRNDAGSWVGNYDSHELTKNCVMQILGCSEEMLNDHLSSLKNREALTIAESSLV